VRTFSAFFIASLRTLRTATLPSSVSLDTCFARSFRRSYKACKARSGTDQCPVACAFPANRAPSLPPGSPERPQSFGEHRHACARRTQAWLRSIGRRAQGDLLEGPT
jgi:hypothetical protein